jgi:ubiquinone biosynthesis protein COQ4
MTSDEKTQEEREAAAIALEGGKLQRAALGLRALARLMRDPDDTHQVFLIGLLVNKESYPRFLARLTSDEEGARLLRERPAIDSAHVDFDALRALPDGTLGREYVRYLDERGLDPDLFQAPPGLPEVPGYIAQRMRQVHDVWHVLTGYDTDVPGEVALQAFTWAQTRMTSSAMIAISGAVVFWPRWPKIMSMAVRGYRRGRGARFLPPVAIESYWERPVEEVRRELSIAA